MLRKCFQVGVKDALLFTACLVVAVTVGGCCWVEVLSEPKLRLRLQVVQTSEDKDAMLVQQIFNLLEVFRAGFAGMKAFDYPSKLGYIAGCKRCRRWKR